MNGPRLGRLVNHGSKKEINGKMRVCEDRLGQPQLVLYAVTDIKEDKEILYDYGVAKDYVFPPPIIPTTKDESNAEIKDPGEMTDHDGGTIYARGEGSKVESNVDIDDDGDDPYYVCESESDISHSEDDDEPAILPGVPLALKTRGRKEMDPRQDQRERNQRISVMQTNNDPKHGRTYDKVAYCMFCRRPHKKLPDHLRTQHKNEVEVSKYMSAISNEGRNYHLTLIRNKGNHMHNYEVLEKGEGELIVVYRPNYRTDPKDFSPCPNCLGWYSKNEMWKHKCVAKPGADSDTTHKKKKAKLLEKSKLLRPPPAGIEINDILHRVLSGMRDDKVKSCIMADDVLIELAKGFCHKLGHDEEQYDYIRCKVRELARLVIEYRQINNDQTAKLASLIKPTEFIRVIEAVKVVAGFDNSTHLFSTPSLALKLGHSLKKAAMVLLNRALMDRDGNAMKTEMEKFLKLMEYSWEVEVSTHALRTLYEGKRNNPQLLAMTSDVVILSQYLQKTAERSMEDIENEKSVEERCNSWNELNKCILTHLIVFNRKCQGEISKMTLKDHGNIQKGKSHVVEGQMDMLSGMEKELVELLWRVEIRGKKGRTVPILITNFWKSCLDALVKYRTELGTIDPSNNYIFASSGSSHIRGSDTLRSYSTKCGARAPELLRSTHLRKHIATMVQLMSLRENELDVLANYMGHDLRIHREFYRLPSAAVQVAKISKFLFAMDGRGGDPVRVIGNAKTLDDLELNANEVLQVDDEDARENEDDEDDEIPSQGQTLSIHNKKVERPAMKRSSVSSEITELPCKKGKEKRKWSVEEKAAVLKHLRHYVNIKKLPGKEAIEKCLQAEPCLQDRSWRNIKDFCRNAMKSKSSKSVL